MVLEEQSFQQFQVELEKVSETDRVGDGEEGREAAEHLRRTRGWWAVHGLCRQDPQAGRLPHRRVGEPWRKLVP